MADKKIVKAGGAQPDEFEMQVAQEIHQLEVSKMMMSTKEICVFQFNI